MRCNAVLSITALAVGLMLGLGALLPTPGEATVLAKGACAPAGVAYIVSDASQQTMSQNDVVVTETRVNFTQGGTKSSCIVVSFSAEATAEANEVMRVSAILDDVTRCDPGTNFAVGNGGADIAARAMNFVCKSVAPGPHFVRMYFNSVVGGKVYLFNRTTIVHYSQ